MLGSTVYTQQLANVRSQAHFTGRVEQYCDTGIGQTVPYVHIQLVPQRSDSNEQYRWLEQATPENCLKTSKHSHLYMCAHSQMDSRQVSPLFTAAQIKDETEQRQERLSVQCVFFCRLRNYQGAAERSGGGSFQHYLTEPLFSTKPSHSHFSFSLCLLFLAVNIAVHLSVQLANWALSVTGPLANSDHRNPFNQTAFKHLWFHHGLTSSFLLCLKLLNEADEGQKDINQKRLSYPGER